MKLYNRYLVTGVNGYLGSSLARKLSCEGNEVIGFCRDSNRIRNLLGENQYITILPYEEYQSTLMPGDCIIHCAGQTTSARDWDEIKRTNVDWSLELFSQAHHKGASAFIYISSIAAIGYTTRSAEQVTEETIPKLRKGELYGKSKLLAESMLLANQRNNKIRLLIIRPGLVYGGRPVSPAGKNRFPLLGREVIVDSKARVPLVHIDNLVDAFNRLISRTDLEGIFQIIDDEQPNLRDLNELKLANGLLFTRPLEIGRIGYLFLEYLKFCIRPLLRKQQRTTPSSIHASLIFNTRKSVYDCTKVKEKTGWVPIVNLEDGLRRLAKIDPASRE